MARAAEHDYVIVGAGAAGCVLANRLSEKGASVLVLEAGGSDRHPNIAIPAAFNKQFKTKHDWDFETEPEPGCDNRRLYVPRGKSLGGSTSMNAMLYVRGRPVDYDAWREAGCEGWGWAEVEPYFKRSEDSDLGPSEVHGRGGPWRISRSRSPRKLTRRFIESAEAAGIPFNADYNSPEQDGVSPVQVTQRNGRRWSVADAFLRPAMKRDNVDVVKNAQVLGIEIANGRVSGVRYGGRRARESTATARREVILSAGAIGSPQLLLLSGIGPAADLAEHGIDARVDSPGVGGNLQDHPFLWMIWSTDAPEGLATAEHPRYLAEWVLRKSGPLTSNVAEGVAFVRTRPGLPAADVEVHFAPAYFNDHGFDEYDGEAVTLAPTLLTPKSRGRIRLRSSDPRAKPLILGNHLTEDEDLASMIAGVKLSRRIVESSPLAEVVAEELFPGPGVESDDEIEADLRARTELVYHPVGTCRMGSDDEAVVDPELRVRGIDGLRVADASIFPLIPGGNTMAPTVMAAEKAADLIRG